MPRNKQKFGSDLPNEAVPIQKYVKLSKSSFKSKRGRITPIRNDRPNYRLISIRCTHIISLEFKHDFTQNHP